MCNWVQVSSSYTGCSHGLEDRYGIDTIASRIYLPPYMGNMCQTMTTTIVCSTYATTCPTRSDFVYSNTILLKITYYISYVRKTVITVKQDLES